MEQIRFEGVVGAKSARHKFCQGSWSPSAGCGDVETDGGHDVRRVGVGGQRGGGCGVCVVGREQEGGHASLCGGECQLSCGCGGGR